MFKKILVADDERDFVEFLRVALKREGFEVAVAFDGEEAKRRILEENPDLLILDLVMPGISGWDVLSWIREQKKTSLPIIILSAKDSLDEIKKTYDLEADYYLVKPVRVKDILKGIYTLSALKEFKNSERS